MSDTSHFAAWLKRCRQDRGLTQDMLAEQVGCASETIRKLENGRRRPSFGMASRLAQVLQLGPDEHTAWMRAARESSAQEQPPLPKATADSGAQLVTPPIYLTPFVGREHERSDLAGLLRRPDCRLVTLLGPGGVGKTRLAAEVARQVQSFPDGVVWVSLASLVAPQAIVPAIGDALGFNFSGPKDTVGQLLRSLQPRRALIVLDNLEHLLDTSGAALELLERLLVEAPNVTVLATSRERLKIPGEWVVELLGLDVPPADVAPRSGDYSARTLFAELAQRVQHGFRLGPENDGAVTTICQLVEGMPLGIELAAAWLRVLSLDEIGRELLRNLDARHPVSSRLPARHQSLSAVVEHSWQLLTDEERQVLGRLAVFQGGFSREAAHVVAGADLGLLGGLADKSLLRRWSADRYDLHLIIRQYAAERLAEDPVEHAATHGRHAAYFSSWLALHRERLQGRDQAATLAAIGAEIDNVRAAWQSAIAHGQLDAIAQAAETLQWFFEYRNWQQEGASTFYAAAEALRQVAPEQQDARYRHVLGEILGRLGWFAARTCGVQHAREALEQSAVLLRAAGGGRLLAQTLVYQGMLVFSTGDYDGAHILLRDARAHIAAGDAWTHALCDTWETLLAHARGDYEAAERLFWSALNRYRAMENDRGILGCLAFCSSALVARGKYNDASALLREGLMLAVAADDRRGMALVLHQLGRIALLQHSVDEAVYLFREALTLFRVIGNTWDAVRVLNHLGAALQARGAVDEAGDVFREALVTAAESDIVPEALQALAGLAEQLCHASRPAKVLELTARILADPSARTETRDQALRLREAVRVRLPVGALAEAEEGITRRSLTEIAAEFAELPTLLLPRSRPIRQPAVLLAAPRLHHAGS